MKDTGNTTIALLIVTAVILTAMLIGTHFQTSQTVLAEGPARSGSYIMASGRWSAEADLTWVIDLAANPRRLNIYYANPNTNEIELVDTVNLEQAFGGP